MMLPDFKHALFSITAAVLISVAPLSATAQDAEDKVNPENVDQFVTNGVSYSFAQICTNASAKTGWLLFRNRDSISDGMRFLITPSRVIGPEPVTIDTDTQATIDTGDVMGAKAEQVMYLPATIYRAKDGSSVRVVSRENEKLIDYSTATYVNKKLKPESIRCTKRHVRFDKLSQLAANFKETAPHESKVTDSEATKVKNFDNFLKRRVGIEPAPTTREDAK